jgi:hypothetical protein
MLVSTSRSFVIWQDKMQRAVVQQKAGSKDRSLAIELAGTPLKLIS